jgi:dienelactone hydrolase
MLAWLAIVIACGGGDKPVPLPKGPFVDALVFPLAASGPVDPVFGPAVSVPGGTVQGVSLDVFPGFGASAALWIPDRPNGLGALVAHGHYGAGKDAPETQEIARKLAASGFMVVAVDTPGVEEWDRPSRHIHFDEGGGNRAWLASHGSSAMALQLAVLRRGLDLLSSRAVVRVVALGASGGAVQAHYLSLIDARVVATVHAAFPNLPREARAGGCACDQVPGFAGPMPEVLAMTRVPSLWLSDVAQGRPAGLPADAAFQVFEGMHSYTAPMQVRTLDWLARTLDLSITPPPTPQALELEAPMPTDRRMPIWQLPLAEPSPWVPVSVRPVPFELRCEGEGAAELRLGAAAATPGHRSCVLLVSDDPVRVAEALVAGRVPADAVLAAARRARDRLGAVRVAASGPWALIAAKLGLPYGLVEPLPTVDRADGAPPWVHVPGAWTGIMDAAIAGAEASAPGMLRGAPEPESP